MIPHFGFSLHLPEFVEPTQQWTRLPQDPHMLFLFYTLFHPAILDTLHGHIGCLPITIKPSLFQGVVIHRRQMAFLSTHLFKRKTVTRETFTYLQDVCGTFLVSKTDKHPYTEPLTQLWGLEGDNCFLVIPIGLLRKIAKLFISKTLPQAAESMGLQDYHMGTLRSLIVNFENDPPKKSPWLPLKFFEPMHATRKDERVLLGRRLTVTEVRAFQSLRNVLTDDHDTTPHLFGILNNWVPSGSKFDIVPKKRKQMEVPTSPTSPPCSPCPTSPISSPCRPSSPCRTSRTVSQISIVSKTSSPRVHSPSPKSPPPPIVTSKRPEYHIMSNGFWNPRIQRFSLEPELHFSNQYFL